MERTRKRRFPRLSPDVKNHFSSSYSTTRHGWHSNKCSQVLIRLLLLVWRYKSRLLLILAAILLMVFILWPVPKLSQHAQHWHDSGYFFRYGNNNIFYQDIFKLKPNIQLKSVLLILHGFPTSSYDWKHVIPKLHERYGRVIIPDMLGLGFSDKPKAYEYSIKEQATIQEKLLSYLHVTDVHLLAHDYGDSVSQELLARHSDPHYKLPFNIKSVCLTNGGILPGKHEPRLIQKAMLVPILGTVISYLSNYYMFKSRFSLIFGPHSQPSIEDITDFWSILRHNEGNLVFPDILRYLSERKRNEKRWILALQDTSVPLHLVYGPLDPINTPDKFLKSYKELIPRSTVSVLDDVGHYPHIEDEAGFMNSYNTFLDSVKN